MLRFKTGLKLKQLYREAKREILMLRFIDTIRIRDVTKETKVTLI